MSYKLVREDIASTDHLLSIVKRVQYIALTVTKDITLPRTTPVFYAFDPETKISYWLSNKNSQHSKNIEQNNNASLIFIDRQITNKSIDFSRPLEGIGATASLVTNDDEKRRAYKLLKQKARTLPEQIEDFDNPNALRSIYKARANQHDTTTLPSKDSLYMVLGTSPKSQPRVIITQFSINAEGNVQLNTKTTNLSATHTHACIFDADVSQGDGIGVYFNGQIAQTPSNDLIMKPEKDDNGRHMLTTNGLYEYQGIRGWIDKQTRAEHTILTSIGP